MGKNVDFIKTYLAAEWANPPSSMLEAGTKYLADDFKNIDGAGNVVMNKEAYLGMGQLLTSAFQDFKWVVSDLIEADDGVLMTGHFEGTHTGDLDLSALGAGVVPASGKKIVWPEATVKWEIKDNKILSERSVGDSGGVEEFLAALGVTTPKA